ncbi:FixH family protein [Adhaeribacter rhizoryzae]|uniref:Nitrogen fixation protein FixH n=1 Tax=Adhaeribacter rhizoryzae TaxID=2607907 RepID=A0A5M6D4E3_9BACT|nr:FixH family protein [Adhaeribacter rhizoryzae]KAA5541162.1 nitrogen fixation protein FixH [Adhaeribacter rhizoryzae]
MNTPTVNSRKSGWFLPYVITGAFICFMSYIIFFVTQAMRSEVNLVSKDYYQQELDYQKHIEVMNRTAAQNQAVTVAAPAGTNQVILNMAVEANEKITGTINFFRPSDGSQDFQVPLKLNESQNQVLNTEKLSKGLWRVKVNYNRGNQHYYNETQITLQ